MSEGDIVVQTIHGDSITYTIPAARDFPYRLWLRIRQIISTGTTIPVADVIALKG